MPDPTYPEKCVAIAEALGWEHSPDQVDILGWRESPSHEWDGLPTWHGSPEAACGLRREMERAGWEWGIGAELGDSRKQYEAFFYRTRGEIGVNELVPSGCADTEAHAIVDAAYAALCGGRGA